MAKRKQTQTTLDKILMMVGVAFFVLGPFAAFFISWNGCTLFPPAVSPRESFGVSCYVPIFWTFFGTLALFAIVGGALTLFSLRKKR